jgi:hypothetical protein
LRPGELVGAIGGLGLLVSGFLPWYSFLGNDVTAWQAFSVTDIVLAGAAGIALSVAVCVLFRISVSYPVAGSTVATLFGSVAVILIAIRLINPPGPNMGVVREFGAWLGLASAIGITLGGYLGMQEQKATSSAAH